MLTNAVPLAFDAAGGLPAKPTKDTRDFLLRGLPVEVAASPHRKSMREYMLEVLETHLKELERKGITLTLPKGK